MSAVQALDHYDPVYPKIAQVQLANNWPEPSTSARGIGHRGGVPVPLAYGHGEWYTDVSVEREPMEKKAQRQVILPQLQGDWWIPDQITGETTVTHGVTNQ